MNHQQIVVINADAAPWEGLVEAEPWLDLDTWGDRWLSDAGGEPVDVQIVEAEAPQLTNRLVFPLRLEAKQARHLLVRDDPRPPAPPMRTDLVVDEGRLANRHLEVTLGEQGIAQIRAGGMELLAGGGIGLHLRHEHTDTWTFHTDRFEEPIAARFGASGWTVEETGPLRGRVWTEGTLGGSSLRWTLSLCRDDPRLFMRLEVNFDERHKALQLPVQLSAVPGRWTAGLAGGQVEREPGPTEWPVQGWSRLEVIPRPLAIVTQDAYSLSLAEDCWQWTLLRSPKMAWGGGQPKSTGRRDGYTDQGRHTFDFVWHTGEQTGNEALHTAARQLAQPLVVFDRYDGMDRPLRKDQRNTGSQPLFQREDSDETRH